MENFLKETNTIKKENQKIMYSGDKMLLVLQEIEFMLLSLHKIGSYYFDKDRREYERETTDFIDHSFINAIQLSIISVVFCHREPLFFMPKNFKNITKNS